MQGPEDYVVLPASTPSAARFGKEPTPVENKTRSPWQEFHPPTEKAVFEISLPECRFKKRKNILNSRQVF